MNAKQQAIQFLLDCVGCLCLIDENDKVYMVNPPFIMERPAYGSWKPETVDHIESVSYQEASGEFTTPDGKILHTAIAYEFCLKSKKRSKGIVYYDESAIA